MGIFRDSIFADDLADDLAFRRNIITIQSNYNVLVEDDIIFGENGLDIFLFSAEDNFGKELAFKLIDNGKMTVRASGSELIENGASIDVKNNNPTTIVASGSSWWII